MLADRQIHEKRPLPEAAKKLPSEVIRKICSGQVITGLESAVKELIENAIDAKATIIDVQLVNYGVDCITVSDNGKGIPKSDHLILGQRHSTSKLKEFKDLSDAQLDHFGFRGEAMHSLASLSKAFTIVTKHATDKFAWKLQWNESTQSMSTLPTARQEGTTVIVESLFEKIPVRFLEFTKSAIKDVPKLLALFHSYLLTNPHVGFNCSNFSSKSKAKTSIFSISYDTKRSLKLVIDNLFSKSITDNLIYFDLPLDIPSYNNVQFVGWISNPFGRTLEKSKLDFISICGHPCVLPEISKAIHKLFKEMLPTIAKPFLFLNIFIEPSSKVDLNLAPDKRTVFLESQDLIIRSMIDSMFNFLKGYAHRTTTLNNEDTISSQVNASFKPIQRKIEVIPSNLNIISNPRVLVDLSEGTDISSRDKIGPKTTFSSLLPERSKSLELNQKALSFQSLNIPPAQLENQQEIIHISSTKEALLNPSAQIREIFEDSIQVLENPEPDHITLSITKNDFLKMEPIGQFNYGFIIARLNSNLFILDQHACDEKFRYEQLKKTFYRGPAKTQKLLLPLKLNQLSRQEILFLELNLGKFENFGFKFDMRHTASNEYIDIELIERPVFPETINLEQGDIQELIHYFEEAPHATRYRLAKLESYFASKACRTAVMIGLPLRMKEMEQIIRHLSELDQPWNCPHGRPTLRHLYQI